MQRRQFMLVLAAGGVSLALAACDSMPASAVLAWQAAAGEHADPRLRALSWALLAPSPHNMQSWVADIREPGVIRLHVDLQRLLPASDPQGRQVLIGCGAFLELLCIAATQDGYRAEVELLPEGEFGPDRVDTRPFAELRLVRDPAITADPLLATARDRRTNRSAYDESMPPARVLAALVDDASRPGVQAGFSRDAAQTRRLTALAIEGLRIDFFNAECWRETARVMHLGADEVAAEPSGLALLGTGIWWGRMLGIVSHASLQDADGPIPKRGFATSRQAMEQTPAWFWLSTANNSRRSQIEAGRAYLRLALSATRSGLAIQPASQLLQEYSGMNAAFMRLHRELDVAAPARVQMLVRVGYASPPGPSPRRTLEKILLT